VRLNLPCLHFGRVGGTGSATSVFREVIIVRYSCPDNVSQYRSATGKFTNFYLGSRALGVFRPWRVHRCELFEADTLSIGFLISKVSIREILMENPLSWRHDINGAFENNEANTGEKSQGNGELNEHITTAHAREEGASFGFSGKVSVLAMP